MFKRTVRWVDRGLGWLEDWTLFIGVLMALLSALSNIVMRKLTHSSLYWSDEVVMKVIFVSTYIGCSAAVRRRALIRIDALPQLLPVVKKPLTLISHLAMLVFAGIMLHFGGDMMLTAFRDPFARTTTLQIPEWLFYAVLPVMGGLLVVRTLLVIVDDWRGQPPEQGK